MNSQEREEQRNLVLDALLNTQELRHRYHHQADFYHAMNLMVRSLPKHVEALAASADEAEVVRNDMIERLERG